MMYLRPTNKHKSSAKTYGIWVLVLFVLILALARPPIPDSVRSVFVFLGAPFWYVGENTEGGMRAFSILFKDKEASLKRIEELEEEIRTLRLESLSYSIVLEENTSLRTLLNRSLSEEAILASVLTRRTPYDSFLIDIGREQGVEEGYPVQSKEGVVIGEVYRVYNTTSLVALFSSPGRETPVQIGSERIEVLARGLGAGSFEAFVPRGVTVREGESVVLPGVSPSVFAVVGSVSSSPTDPLQRVLFQNPVNFFEISFVAVMPSITREVLDISGVLFEGTEEEGEELENEIELENEEGAEE